MKLWLPLLAVLMLLGGCSAMHPRDFEGSTPQFDLYEYFDGTTRAWGIFQDRSGMPRRQFRVDIRGEIDGDDLTLTEDFVYSDGETQRRVWQIRRIDRHRYEGRADDVVGTATGLAQGQALNWRYTLRLPYRGRKIDVKFDDWMFLLGDGVMVNRATASKFGLKVGEVTLFFTKEGAPR